MSLSLNEVEVLAKKAARGAGYPWGFAEEAGKAVRWLCARGVDGCSALAELLAEIDGTDMAKWQPIPGDVWEAAEGSLCPIAAGAALADGLADVRAGEVNLKRTVAPLLVLPFVAQIAARTSLDLRVDWPGGGAVTDGRDLQLEGDLGGAAATLAITRADVIELAMTRATRADPDAGCRAVLERFAHRTYAPATEESRLKGAGAGLSDND